ncbi:unnamed protein product [Adineta ricciae]|uniref:TIR domain-containing protein n=1 Tax=Adineta ricciae TaxID=249248 RepID=A0A816BGR6_ADIRI|nr:unnamed protein product [Adineta ricciae]
MAFYKEYTQELDTAAQELASPVYQEAFEAATKAQFASVPSEHIAILTRHPNTIAWYAGDQRQRIIERIRQAQLKWFNKWIHQYGTGQSFTIENENVFDTLTLHLLNILFRLDHGDVITTKDIRDEFEQIAKTIKHCLIEIKEVNPITLNKTTLLCVRELFQVLFYFTLDNDLIIYLKSLELIDLINTMMQLSDNHKEILLHAYRILAVLMSEADIKQLQNAERIASVFIEFIQSTINGGDRMKERLHNNLRSLNVLTQHDVIRDELIKQNGQRYFLRCALEEKFDPVKAKLPSLQILLALSFNDEFATSLKNNTTFMAHVLKLKTSSDENLQRIATALIWQLETTSETKDEQKEMDHQSSKSNKKQYDIMISYSHSDDKLCHQILQRLEQEKFNIWIDFQKVHGNLTDTIAEAIENSEIVLICMSDAYKQSPVCKLEASYAAKRGCHIIPLVMTPKYKADGWLGLITSDRLYVDFKKMNFDEAFKQLKYQIQRNRTNVAQTPAVNQKLPEKDHLSSTSADPQPIEIHVVLEYPHCIDTWTEEHVKSFLVAKKIPSLLGAFQGMNGRLLHRLYDMCQSNQQAMFVSLKEDVAQSSNASSLLTLKDYLIFLEEIKAYIPYKSGAGTQINPTSAVCSLM